MVKQSKLAKIALFLIIVMLFSTTASATMNVAVITDPTGKDPNGCAAEVNHLQLICSSQHLYSHKNIKWHYYQGEGSSNVRVAAIISALTQLQNNGTPEQVVNVANGFDGIRLMAVNPTQGIAVGEVLMFMLLQ